MKHMWSIIVAITELVRNWRAMNDEWEAEEREDAETDWYYW